VTYLQFHLLFIVPPLALLLAMGRPALRRTGRAAGLAVGGLAVLALAYTVPWDSYLIRRGVWAYGEARVVATLWRIPVEELLFIVLQTVAVGVWAIHLLARGRPGPAPGSGVGRWVGAVIGVKLAILGAVLLGRPDGTYLGLILLWAAPPLALQWLWGADLLTRHRRTVVLGTSLPTLYLWLADAFAIRAGVWTISGDHTLGLSLAGLPLEEAVFFLATTLLVVQGVVLLTGPGLHPEHR
jgi:lycopene beta-cyclase